MKRIYNIDFTRGLVMIIMALDHVRDLIHVSSVTQSPTDLATTTPMLFFTRWITYLCAPIFVFLAGTSAYISFKNKGNPAESSRFLVKRGLWLILLEFSFVNLGLFFDLGFHNLIFEVIAAIGFGFIILAALLKQSPKMICLTGLVIIFFHGLFPLIPFGPGSGIKSVLSPLFSPGIFPISSNRAFIMGYPPIPWLGIMMVGFASGKLFELPITKRKKIFMLTGWGSLLLFVILRLVNMYGDPFRWSIQKTPIYSFLSFMNITKYPPSLLFCLVTLGIMFLIFAFTSQSKSWIGDMVSVYGKTPLFYFILHFYIIHSLLIVVLFLQGFHWADMNFASGIFGRPKEGRSGIPLGLVYIIWIAVVMVLYKPCAWFWKYKTEHKNWWLKYI